MYTPFLAIFPNFFFPMCKSFKKRNVKWNVLFNKWVIPCQINQELPLTSQILGNDWDPWETARNGKQIALGLLISEIHANELWAN